MRIPTLARLLGRSALPDIGETMRRVVVCTDELPKLFEALIAGDQEQVVIIAKTISNLECDADEAKNAAREHLPSFFMMPIDRRDVLKLLTEIDAIADAAEDVGVLLTLRKFTVPDPMAAFLGAFVERVRACVAMASQLVA